MLPPSRVAARFSRCRRSVFRLCDGHLPPPENPLGVGGEAGGLPPLVPRRNGGRGLRSSRPERRPCLAVAGTLNPSAIRNRGMESAVRQPKRPWSVFLPQSWLLLAIWLLLIGLYGRFWGGHSCAHVPSQTEFWLDYTAFCLAVAGTHALSPKGGVPRKWSSSFGPPPI